MKKRAPDSYYYLQQANKTGSHACNWFSSIFSLDTDSAAVSSEKTSALIQNAPQSSRSGKIHSHGHGGLGRASASLLETWRQWQRSTKGRKAPNANAASVERQIVRPGHRFGSSARLRNLDRDAPNQDAVVYRYTGH